MWRLCEKIQQKPYHQMLNVGHPILIVNMIPLSTFREYFNDPATLGASTDRDKECKINVLKMLTPRYSFKVLREAGFLIGDKIYARALDSSNSGPGIYHYERAVPAGNTGRPRAVSDTAVESLWMDRSKPSADGTYRLAHRSAAAAAKEIQNEAGVSRATAYRRRPLEILPAVRATDLCDYCESARLCEMEFLNALGKEPDMVESQKVSRAAFQNLAAAERERCSVMDPEKYEFLELAHRHRELAAEQDRIWQLHRELAAEPEGDAIVFRFDYSGAVPLENPRSVSQDFFQCKRVGLFGMLAWYRGKRYQYALFSTSSNDHDSFHSKHYIVYLIEYCIRALGRWRDRAALSLYCWCDTGLHFRSLETLYHLTQKFRVYAGASISYDVEHHGKSELDACFSSLKSQIRSYTTYWNRATLKADLEAALRSELDWTVLMGDDVPVDYEAERIKYDFVGVAASYCFNLFGGGCENLLFSRHLHPRAAIGQALNKIRVLGPAEDPRPHDYSALKSRANLAGALMSKESARLKVSIRSV